MKFDYQVKDIYSNEVYCDSFNEAVKEAWALIKLRPDCDPVIDQFYKDDELTGKYWVFRNGKFVKPSTLKQLLN